MVVAVAVEFCCIFRVTGDLVLVFGSMKEAMEDVFV